jgi:isoquinoline 1-oxidoreductase alpha subunit
MLLPGVWTSAMRVVCRRGSSKHEEMKMIMTLTVNNESHSLDVDPDTPLLWIIRDHLNMTGTKFGCGIGQCGACTVHLNGVAVRSCSIPASAAQDIGIATIESLPLDNSHALQRAWIELNVPQCGYCPSGMLMAAAALLSTNPNPSDTDIDRAITNICRCGTYPRIRAAIHRAAQIPVFGSD